MSFYNLKIPVFLYFGGKEYPPSLRTISGISLLCVQCNIVRRKTCKMVLYVYIITYISHKTYKLYVRNSTYILKIWRLRTSVNKECHIKKPQATCFSPSSSITRCQIFHIPEILKAVLVTVTFIFC